MVGIAHTGPNPEPASPEQPRVRGGVSKGVVGRKVSPDGSHLTTDSW